MEHSSITKYITYAKKALSILNNISRDQRERNTNSNIEKQKLLIERYLDSIAPANDHGDNNSSSVYLMRVVDECICTDDHNALHNEQQRRATVRKTSVAMKVPYI